MTTSFDRVGTPSFCELRRTSRFAHPAIWIARLAIVLDEDVSARSSILIQLSNSQSHACNAVIARPRVPPCSPEGRLREAIQRRSMILDCFVAYAPRNDADGCTSTSPRRDQRPRLRISFHPRKIEGAGKAGCRPHPWSACSKKARGRTTGSAKTSRPSLHDGLRLIRALPGAPGCLATVASETRKRLRRLNTSVGVSGPRDFAVREWAARHAARPRPPHPASHVS